MHKIGSKHQEVDLDKRNTSKSCSDNKTKNSKQDKTTVKQKNNPDKRSDLKVDSTKSKSDRSISSRESSSKSYLKNTSIWLTKTRSNSIPKSKSISKSKSESPIRTNNKSSKPNYQWIPKVAKLEEISIDLCCLSNEKEMSWEQVMTVDCNGKPSLSMKWVPKSN